MAFLGGRLPALKLITFDVTGTLLKFRKNPVDIYADFAGGSKYGLQVDRVKLKDAFRETWTRLNFEIPNYGNSWRTWWTQFVVQTFMKDGVILNGRQPDLNPTLLHDMASDLIEHFSTDKCWEAKEGAKDLLLKIKSSQQMSPALQMGVISNFDTRLHRILLETQLASYFDFVLTSHECQFSKPDARIFHMALGKAAEKTKIQPNEALHVGDNYQLDFVGAVGAKWEAALVIPPAEIGGQGIPLNILHGDPPLVFHTLQALSQQF